MSGWCYNMNSKSLVVIADQLMADEALLLWYINKARGIMLRLEPTIVDHELPAL